MIIHPPEVQKRDGEVEVSARVELTRPIPELPDRLWFRFPESHAPYLALTSDPFASTLLQIAMFLGEDLEVRGCISHRLAYNLLEIESYFHQCQPKYFKPIQLSYESILQQPLNPAGMVGMAFSGGVDSFFTLFKHLPQNQPLQQFRLTHGVFIHGFDIRLFEKNVFDRLYELYKKLFQQLGLELIPARTNAYLFSEFRIDWTYTHGAAIAGIAQALGNLFSHFYISAGLNYLYAAPVGTNPITDPLFSTDSLSIHHTGATHSRMEKISEIGGWPVLFQHLRVCLYEQKNQDELNCKKCGKCVLTSIMLELEGHLRFYEALHNRLGLKDYYYWLTAKQVSFYAKIISRRARDLHRWDIFFPMQIVLFGQWIKRVLLSILHKLPPEKMYWLKRRIFRQRSDFDHPHLFNYTGDNKD
jgi:hypothetical protein